MRSADIGKIIADNERKATPEGKISRKKRYLLGEKPGRKRLYSPATSWIRFQFAGGKIEYHPLKNLNAGNKIAQPQGAFGYVKICQDPLVYDDTGLQPARKIYAEKIQDREDHHSSRAFEIQLMHEWECLCEIYGDIPLPTFIRDDRGEMLKAYVAMPFVSGMSLEKYTNANTDSWSVQRVFSIILNMLYQIKIVHDKGMMHRDIRLDNFIINPDTLAVTLIDFGMSSMAAAKERRFCDKYAIQQHPGMYDELRGRWWDLYHFRKAVLELIAGYNSMPDAGDFFSELNNILLPLSCHDEKNSPDVNQIIWKLEKIGDFERSACHCERSEATQVLLPLNKRHRAL